MLNQWDDGGMTVGWSSQCNDGEVEHPVVYFSWKLLPTRSIILPSNKFGWQVFQDVAHLKTTYDSDRPLRLRRLDLLKYNNHCWNLALQPYQFSCERMLICCYFTLLAHLLLCCLSPSVYPVVLSLPSPISPCFHCHLSISCVSFIWLVSCGTYCLGW